MLLSVLEGLLVNLLVSVPPEPHTQPDSTVTGRARLCSAQHLPHGHTHHRVHMVHGTRGTGTRGTRHGHTHHGAHVARDVTWGTFDTGHTWHGAQVTLAHTTCSTHGTGHMGHTHHGAHMAQGTRSTSPRGAGHSSCTGNAAPRKCGDAVHFKVQPHGCTETMSCVVSGMAVPYRHSGSCYGCCYCLCHLCYDDGYFY